MKILDENTVHKIEVLEVELTESEIQKIMRITGQDSAAKCIVCDVDEDVCFGKIDTRGKKSKFWIPDGENQYAYLVKYEERDVKTEEDAGQFLMCGLLEQLNLPYAKYLVTEFTSENKPYDAIISKNYRKNKNTREMSGSTLNQKWGDTNYDNNFGAKPRHRHSVDYYCHIIKSMYSKNNIDFEQLRLDLLKYCLLQYVFNMSDLHYYNLSFSYDILKGHDTFELNPYYDCGNICFLNFSDSKIKHNAAQYAKCRNAKSKEKFVRNLMYSNMPLFGVKTDICHIYQTDSGYFTCRPRSEQYKAGTRLLEAEKDLNTLQRELAEEILANKELSEFYLQIKNLDIDKAAEKYNSIKQGVIPDFCISIVKAIKNETEIMLDEVLVEIEKTRSLGSVTTNETRAEQHEIIE